MKGAKPTMSNVLPMKGDAIRVPDAPEWMSEEGREVWDELAPAMAIKRRLEKHFERGFAAYCEAAADYMRFTGEIAAFGSYYETETRNGKQEKHRAVWRQREDALSAMLRIGALFGMTPVDETRLSNGAQGDFLDQLREAMRDGAS